MSQILLCVTLYRITLLIQRNEKKWFQDFCINIINVLIRKGKMKV